MLPTQLLTILDSTSALRLRGVRGSSRRLPAARLPVRRAATARAIVLACLLGFVLGGAPAGAAKASSPVDEIEPQVPPRAWSKIVLHHSATRGGSVASIDAVHRQQKDRSGAPWLGIGYHFVIGNGRDMGDGVLEPTFRWARQLPGAHAGRREENERGIGICLIGNFDETPPTARQMDTLNSLLRSLAARFSIPPECVLRHSDVQATRCPGRLFPWGQVVAGLEPASGS